MQLVYIFALIMPIVCLSEAFAAASPALPFDMPEVRLLKFADRAFNIRDYGALSGGIKLNTEAFAKAIDACNKAGGGRVVVPAGKWLTGPIHLKSNVNLHLEKNAQILFSTNPDHYLPAVFTRWEGMECCTWSPLIYANGCVNVAITGEGTLNGQGEEWWKMQPAKKPAARKLYDMVIDNVPVKQRIFGSAELPLRPSFIQPINCKNVLIEGVTVVNGPMWTVHPVYCENLTVRGISVHTNGPNTDGIIPDSCRNVIIEDCFFTTGDDCIVIKSGLNEEGWKINRPTENVIIRRCKTQRGHGGVVIGSEMSGGVRNIYVEDCDFNGTKRGIRMKSMRGRGGVVENVWVRNLVLDQIPGEVVQVNMFYGSSTVPPKTNTPPVFRNITISDITCKHAERAIELIGLPESPLKNVVIENCDISAKKGVYAQDVDGIKLINADLSMDDSPVVHLVNGRNVTISGTRCPAGTGVFMKVQGENSSGIKFVDCDLSGVDVKVETDENVPPDAVR